MVSVTPSHIIQYLYCPRFTYFEYVLRIPQNEDKYLKVRKGRNIHDLKMVRNKDYLRKKIGAIKKWTDQYLTNEHIRGKVDEVLLLKDGTMAPLDYKFAEYKGRIFDTYRQQAYCYSILIEDNFNTKVEKAYLIYTRSKDKLVEIRVEEDHKQLIRNSIREVAAIIEKNIFPRATKFKRRCLNCTYRNICIQ